MIRVKNLTLLNIEQDSDLEEIVSSIFKEHFKKVISFKNETDGLEYFSKHSNDIDVVLTSISSESGVKFFKKFEEINSNVPVYVVSEYTNSSYLLEAINTNIEKFILKPLDLKRFVNFVEEKVNKKMRRKIIYPGSFDPITLGHEDIIRRMSKTYYQSECHILVANNRDKKHMFNIKKRTKLVKAFVKKENLKNVKVIPFEGVVSDYVNENNIEFVVRGLRDGVDLDYEKKIEMFTQDTTLAETVYFSTQPQHSAVSSSQVRNFIKFGYEEKIDNLVSKKTKKLILKK